jgi:hypothetical protein
MVGGCCGGDVSEKCRTRGMLEWDFYFVNCFLCIILSAAEGKEKQSKAKGFGNSFKVKQKYVINHLFLRSVRM